jgi:leucyl-tRNA synthetase
VPAGASNEQIEQAVHADAKVTAALAGKQVVKVIVVPKKLVNIVVK